MQSVSDRVGDAFAVVHPHSLLHGHHPGQVHQVAEVQRTAVAEKGCLGNTIYLCVGGGVEVCTGR